MPITLEGSCHCGIVRFAVESSTPVPYQLCVCSICRKVGGVGGSINLGAHSKTLNITEGKEHIGVYKAVMDKENLEQHIASSERNFCTKCSSMLWLYDETSPELLHPFASVIDSPELEAPDELVVVKMNSKPNYVRLPEGGKKVFKDYSGDSIESWHKKHNKYVE
ncbi:Mss4-like protein [Suillus clintonianus]|uniref:Mss4-like protein n=1 Tax=Suillus clintonianus TaxID=1904413 RepID=UPI001B87E23B|nr:Mss4-like protein [Suillus clintonianus]KAG2123826.1 Mss4-like protein [Suillus clintonianus]